tara:strand:- start:15861 stop:16367 length:507 start_codon:yes stop_codon:yes gene_type:complete
MSRWGKPIKNKKRKDPRYFLNESIELDEADNGFEYQGYRQGNVPAAKTPYERYAQQGYGEFEGEPPMGPYTDKAAEQAIRDKEFGDVVETDRALRAYADLALDKSRPYRSRRIGLTRLEIAAGGSGQTAANAQALLDAVRKELHKQKMKNRGGLSPASPEESEMDALP